MGTAIATAVGRAGWGFDAGGAGVVAVSATTFGLDMLGGLVAEFSLHWLVDQGKLALFAAFLPIVGTGGGAFTDCGGCAVWVGERLGGLWLGRVVRIAEPISDSATKRGKSSIFITSILLNFNITSPS